MNFLKRLRREECGQGLTEFILVVVLVALVLWLAIQNMDIGNILTSGRPKSLTALPYYFLFPLVEVIGS
jgi:Flp pilus assembly pilin Flp